MFQGLSRTEIIGYVSKDPDVRTTGTGKKVCNFSIPTSRKWGEGESTEWHRLVAWDRLAEIVEQYVRKGTLLHIDGVLQTRSWEKDGVTRYTTEIVVQKLTLLPGKGKKDGPAKVEDESDEIPF